MSKVNCVIVEVKGVCKCQRVIVPVLPDLLSFEVVLEVADI